METCWGVTAGDRDESAGEEGEGRKRERERRQETMGSLATSLGEDHSKREVTACQVQLSGAEGCEMLEGTAVRQQLFFWPGLAQESSFRMAGSRDGE